MSTTIEAKLQEEFDVRARMVEKALADIKHTWVLELSTLAHGVPRNLDIEGETKRCHEIIDQLAEDLKATV